MPGRTERAHGTERDSLQIEARQETFGGRTGCKAERTSVTKLRKENESRIGAL